MLLVSAGRRVEEFRDEFGGARACNCAQVIDQVRLAHSNTGVDYVQNVVLLVGLNILKNVGGQKIIETEGRTFSL